jgi:hypothetical protein
MHRLLRSTAVASLMAVPLVFTLGTAAQGGSSDEVMPPMSCSNRPEFSNPTRIDNRFFPLAPGRESVYEGSVTEAGERTPHRVVFTVTSLTKVIEGVKTRVVWDRDFADGELEETELAFFAQDDDGTVWLFGEYPEEWEEGEFVGAPDVWITCMATARGGIHMLEDPEVGDAYVQGKVPRIEFFDVAEVVDRGLRTCVPVDCFDHVLLTHESGPLDPAGGVQTKYYAPHVGLVRIGAIGGDAREAMTLRSRTVLRGDSLEEVNQEAKRLDRRGHRIDEVYARTAPVR